MQVGAPPSSDAASDLGLDVTPAMPEPPDDALDTPAKKAGKTPQEALDEETRTPAAEPEKPAEVPQPADAQSEPPPVQPTPTIPEWANIDDVKVDALPDEVKPWAEAILSAAKNDRVDLARVQSQLVARMQEFDDLIKRLEDAGATDARPLAERVEATTKELQGLREQHLAVTWEAFQARHPDYKGLPQELKNAFADILESPQFDNLRGAHDLDRMEEAFSYAQYKVGFRPATAPVAPRVVPPATPAAPAGPAAQRVPPSRQAAVATGTEVPTPGKARPEDRKPEEILKQHDRLLGDLPER